MNASESLEYRKEVSEFNPACCQYQIQLRDYFARSIEVDKILDTLTKEQIEILMNKVQPHSIRSKIIYQAEVRARLQYLFADAMMAARESNNMQV
ncbi:hypothetical protein [Flavobacterium sp. 22076]|uniref:hypothetical protein n=1 Tax=unclassified Flavobacterium TaxID=196869 RepID=UPI003F8585AE